MESPLANHSAPSGPRVIPPVALMPGSVKMRSAPAVLIRPIVPGPDAPAV